MADARITDLARLIASNAQPDADVLAVADVSTAETKKITLSDAVQSGIASVADGSIPGQKLAPGSVTTTQIADGSVEASDIADNAVTTSKINNGAVTPEKIEADSITADQIAAGAISTSELAENAVDTASIQDSAITAGKIADGAVGSTQIENGAITSTEIKDGTIVAEDLADEAVSTPKIEDRAVTTEKLALLSVTEPILGNGAVTGIKVADATITANKLADDLDGSEFLPQPPNFILAGPASGSNARAGFRQITSADLPVISSAKLPIASKTQLGVVQVGDGLSSSVGGTLRISNTVVPKTGVTKVSYDANGLITASSALTADDIPELDASKITSGEVNGNILADRSVEEIALADYSTCFVQEGQPSGDPKLGQFWFTPSTNQLKVFGRGSGNDLWLSVGFGALQAENLRWGGTIDASTSSIVTLTAIGVAEGLTVGGPIPAPTDELSGLYFVVQVAGSSISLLDVSGETFTEADWLLCIDQAQGYTHLNISASGGGGGGATKLSDLTDVNLSVVEADQLLQYNSITGQWNNVSLISGGTF